MARPIVLSNGELHVGLNGFGTVHDFYYSYVGFKNHCAGSNMRHKVGVWINGDLSWIDNPENQPGEWTFEFDYPHDALIGHTRAKNERMGIILEFDDLQRRIRILEHSKLQKHLSELQMIIFI